MRARLLPALLLPLLSCCCLCGCRRGGSAAARPNLLLITLDTTRADRLGCYGHEQALTPNLNGLAEAGVLFEDVQSCVPITLPSHATILTGLAPPEHGLRVNGEGRLPEDIPTLAEILRERGYRTGAVVASPVLARIHGLDRGFDHYDDRMPEAGASAPMRLRPDDDPQHAPYRPGSQVADAALAWLAAAAPAGDGAAPWFLWVHFYDPHLPGHWHREIFGERFRHQYDAEMAYMDLHIGRLFDFLGSRGLKERTLVVAVGDHGEGLGDNGEDSHCFFLYRATQHVPLIIAWKGRLDAGRRVPATLGLTDLAPTILDLLQVPPRPCRRRDDPRNDAVAAMRTRSFAPALHGSPVASRVCYMETLWPWYMFRWAPLFGIVNETHKYIRAPRPELYDRRADPRETDNLAAKEARLADEMAIGLETIEARFRRREAPGVTLAADQLRRLQSLGYTAGGASAAGLPENLAALTDVKDVKPIIALQGSVRSRLTHSITDDSTLADCLRLVEVSPDTSLFRVWLGSIHGARGDVTNALAAFQEALRLAPGSAPAHNNLGILLARQNRLPEAIPHFEQAHLAKPDDPELRANLAKALETAGIALARAGHFKEALACFDRVVYLTPEAPSAYLHQGNARAGLGDREGAMAAYRKAIELQPGHPHATRALEYLRRQQQQAPRQ